MVIIDIGLQQSFALLWSFDELLRIQASREDRRTPMSTYLPILSFQCSTTIISPCILCFNKPRWLRYWPLILLPIIHIVICVDNCFGFWARFLVYAVEDWIITVRTLDSSVIMTGIVATRSNFPTTSINCWKCRISTPYWTVEPWAACTDDEKDDQLSISVQPPLTALAIEWSSGLMKNSEEGDSTDLQEQR